MADMIHVFAKRFRTITKKEDVFTVLTDCMHSINQDIYSVCLRVDQETFEMVPIRDIDRILLNNVNECLQHGICGQLTHPNQAVIVTDRERFKIHQGQYILLIPLFHDKVQHGIVMTVFPDTCFDTFHSIIDELTTIGTIASKYYNLLESLNTEEEKNAVLSEKQGKLNDIVQNVVHGLVTLEDNHIISIFNRNAEIIFGIAANAVVGKSYRETLPEKIVRSFDILVETTLIEGSVLDYEVPVELAPGLTIPVGISASVLLDVQGVNQGIICVCRDMSLTKEVNRLKDIDKMKSEFVSMVSHELKNPIAVIKSSVEMLLAAKRLKKELPPEMQDNTLNSINDEINRLSQLINDILNLSRIEAGRVEVKKEPVNIEKLLQSTLHIFKIHEETHPIEISVENIEENVLLDPEKIKQVVINFVNNAIKYTPEGGLVKVRAFIEGDELKFAVTDSGIGIPEDKIKDLFGKFVRIATPETTRISGTGLGLSICKKIVELHRGHVWVESTYKVGSTFGFAIPFTKSTLSNKDNM